MQAKHLFMLFLMFAVATPATLPAQQQPVSPPDNGAPLLTLDDAVSLALKNNRLVKNSSLEAAEVRLSRKHDPQPAAAPISICRPRR